MISTSVQYQILTRDMDRTRNNVLSDKMVQRETEYFKSNIGSIKNPDDLMKDYRLFSYTMKAFGMSDMMYAKALVKKLMSEGVSDPGAMANRMANPLYKELATAFDFNGKDEGVTSAEGFAEGIVDRYVTQTLETREGEKNEGVRLAMYFQRKASTITKPMEILADKAVLRFIQTAFGIPKEASSGDIDRQAAHIARLFDIKDLQDPKKVERLIQRFNAMWDMNNQTAPETSSVAMLFGNNNAVTGFSTNLMLSIAKLPRGGF